jgi:hypothetical protein
MQLPSRSNFQPGQTQRISPFLLRYDHLQAQVYGTSVTRDAEIIVWVRDFDRLLAQ